MRNKKHLISLLALSGIVLSGLQGQDYLIDFTGSGLSTSVNTVEVVNQTSGITLTLNSPDVLQLIGSLGIYTGYNIDSKLRVYPNPMTENSRIEFHNSETGLANIEIIDVTGKTVVSKNEQLGIGDHTFEVEGLNKGIYLIKVYTPDGEIVEKLLSNGKNYGNSIIRYLGNEITSTQKSTLKSSQNIVQMEYNVGERILFKGISGNYSSVLTLIPTQSQTVNFEFIPCTDADNNHYAVVTLGTQTWMAETLNSSKYRNGDSIPNITDSTEWNNLTTGASCFYNNNENNAATYGRLYNWFIINDSRNICPIGWHVPTDAEWTTLVTSLGGADVAGGKLKEDGTAHWLAPNTGATNESGFTALPSGRRRSNEETTEANFFFIGTHGRWWSSTEFDDLSAWTIGMSYEESAVDRSTRKKLYGLAIRCVRD